MIIFIRSFFFQAEDGIRDLTVTGVQTCALPISSRRGGAPASRTPASPDTAGRRRTPRAGEGRVGEESRSLGSPDYLKKKKRVFGETKTQPKARSTWAAPCTDSITSRRNALDVER